MKKEKMPSDVEDLKKERERLDREQDALLEQLKSNPNNEDAKQELIHTLKQIEDIDGKENTNITTILNKLNIRANAELLPEDEKAPEEEEKEYIQSENSPEIKEGGYDDVEAIRDVRREINELFSYLSEDKQFEFKVVKNSLDTKGGELNKMSSEEIADLLDKYELLLQRMRMEIEND